MITDGHVQNAAPPEQPKPKVVLLEHDRRFNIFPEFVYYDFAEPLKLPGLSPYLPFYFSCHARIELLC